MHFVYICRDGDNEELRYSIRSVLENVPDATVTVIGGKPDWYCGHYIEVIQNKSTYHNVMNSLHKAIESPEIPDDFIVMNDDFFIMKPIDTIPIFYGGYLSDKVLLYEDLVPKSPYIRKMRMTHKRCTRYLVDPILDYDLHTPFPVNKQKLYEVIKDKDISYLWRSFYGSYYKIGGQQIKDVKIYLKSPLLRKTHTYSEDDIFISTDDTSFINLQPLLAKKYKKRSALELTPGQIKKRLV